MSISSRLLLPVLLAAALDSPAAEKTIPATALPTVISESFARTYPRARIVKCTRELVHGKSVYEIESSDGPMARDVKYQEDGTVIEVEENIPPPMLPEAVKNTLMARAAPAHRTYVEDVVRVERITRGGTTMYELQLVGQRGTHIIQVSPEGKILVDRFTKKPPHN